MRGSRISDIEFGRGTPVYFRFASQQDQKQILKLAGTYPPAHL